MEELFIKNIHSIGYVESLSLNDSENGIPRKPTTKRQPSQLTLEEIIALKGTEPFYRFHKGINHCTWARAINDPRLKRKHKSKAVALKKPGKELISNTETKEESLTIWIEGKPEIIPIKNSPEANDIKKKEEELIFNGGITYESLTNWIEGKPEIIPIKTRSVCVSVIARIAKRLKVSIQWLKTRREIK